MDGRSALARTASAVGWAASLGWPPQAARRLTLTLPADLLARADEVID
jgi:hypothetical protein